MNNSKIDLGKSTMDFTQSIDLSKSVRPGDSFHRKPRNLASSMIQITDREVSSVTVEEQFSRSTFDLSASCLTKSWAVMPTNQQKLESSWVLVQEDNFIVEREVKDLTKEKKNIDILMKLHLMAIVMEGVVNGTVTVAKNWDKVVCGLAGIVGGGAQMISVNPYNIGIGAVRVAASVKIMWEAYDALTPKEVQKIVNDSTASVHAINLLAKANNDSLTHVQKHLEDAKAQAEAVQEAIVNVARIGGDGKKEVDDARIQAYAAYDKVKESLKNAKEKFELANELSNEAQKEFSEVIKSLNIMVGLFHKKEGSVNQRIEVLANITKEIAAKAENAYEKMENAQALRNEGDAFFYAVGNLQGQALKAFGKVEGVYETTMEIADKELKKIEADLKGVKHNIVKAEEVIVQEVKPRNEDIQKIAQDVVEDLGMLNNILTYKYSLLGLGFCALTTVALNAMMGGVASAALAVTVVAFSHYLRDLFAYLYNKYVVKNALKVDTLVNFNDHKYEFDHLSESFIDRVRGKVSQNKGSLTVKVGIQKLVMRFDFNKKRVLSATDLNALSKKIKEETDRGNITEAAGLQLIKDLKEVEIERQLENILYRPYRIVQKGFIAEDEVLLNETKRKLGEVDIVGPSAIEAVDTIDDFGTAVLWC